MSSFQRCALCIIALVLAISNASACSITTPARNRRLLQTGPNPIGSNVLRAQAATAQAIEAAVDNGAVLGATQRAGVAGIGTAWAAGQENNAFNVAERTFAPDAMSHPGGDRRLLQTGPNPTNLGSNILRAQATTAQAIGAAVDNGAVLGATQRAGMAGVETAWAAGQEDNAFNVAERAFAPDALSHPARP